MLYYLRSATLHYTFKRLTRYSIMNNLSSMQLKIMQVLME